MQEGLKLSLRACVLVRIQKPTRAISVLKTISVPWLLRPTGQSVLLVIQKQEDNCDGDESVVEERSRLFFEFRGDVFKNTMI